MPALRDASRVFLLRVQDAGWWRRDRTWAWEYARRSHKIWRSDAGKRWGGWEALWLWA